MDFVIFLFAILFLLALPFFAICVIWFYLAPNNYFFTFVNEGTAKVVVRGKKFKKCLMSWQGRTFDSDWNVIEGKDNSFWDRFGGLRWIGIYPFDKVYGFKFRWVTFNSEGKMEVHEERWQDYLFLADDYYAFKVPNAEDKNSLPLNLTMVVTMAPINPYKALFNVENWLEAVIARIEPAERDIIGEYSYEEMVGDQKKDGSKETEGKFELDKTFMKRLEDRKFFKQFLDEYGVSVKALQTKEIDPPEAYRAATTTKRIKQYEAEGINALAEAEMGRIDKVYSRIKDFGEVGKLVRMLEAVEKSPLAASMTINAVPGLTQLFEKVFAGKDKK